MRPKKDTEAYLKVQFNFIETRRRYETYKIHHVSHQDNFHPKFPKNFFNLYLRI